MRSVNWQPISLRRSLIARTNSRASPSRIRSSVNSVASTTTQRCPGRPPSPPWPAGELEVVGVQPTGPSGSCNVTLPWRFQLGQQPAAVGRGQQLLHGRQPLAQPRAEPLQVGQHRVGDVLVGPLGEIDLLDVQFVADQGRVFFQPRLVLRSASTTSTRASGWRTLSLASMRARPSETISRTRPFVRKRSSISRRHRRPDSRTDGRSPPAARPLGQRGRRATARFCHISSARNGTNGAISLQVVSRHS